MKIKSIDFITIRLPVIIFKLSCHGRVMRKPITARIPIPKINFNESEWNLNFVGFGNRIDFTSRPFVVLKPVLTIKAVTGLPLWDQVYITSVPEYRVYFLSLLGEYTSWLLSGSSAFTTGTLSPVSIASFITHTPSRSTASQGIFLKFGTSMTSPGTKSQDFVLMNLPSQRT